MSHVGLGYYRHSRGEYHRKASNPYAIALIIIIIIITALRAKYIIIFLLKSDTIISTSPVVRSVVSEY